MRLLPGGGSVDPANGEVRAISARLRELGAEQFESERFGERFYFGCTMAASAGPGGPSIARRFEAEANTPADAAANVLAQVRQFRDRTGGAVDSEIAAARSVSFDDDQLFSLGSTGVAR